MDKFNLHEWLGKGEKNLLKEGRDDDDFLTTISPEEQGVHDDDATREGVEEPLNEDVKEALSNFMNHFRNLSKKTKTEILGDLMLFTFGKPTGRSFKDSVIELFSSIFKRAEGGGFDDLIKSIFSRPDNSDDKEDM